MKYEKKQAVTNLKKRESLTVWSTSTKHTIENLPFFGILHLSVNTFCVLYRVNIRSTLHC